MSSNTQPCWWSCWAAQVTQVWLLPVQVYMAAGRWFQLEQQLCGLEQRASGFGGSPDSELSELEDVVALTASRVQNAESQVGGLIVRLGSDWFRAASVCGRSFHGHMTPATMEAHRRPPCGLVVRLSTFLRRFSRRVDAQRPFSLQVSDIEGKIAALNAAGKRQVSSKLPVCECNHGNPSYRCSDGCAPLASLENSLLDLLRNRRRTPVRTLPSSLLSLLLWVEGTPCFVSMTTTTCLFAVHREHKRISMETRQQLNLKVEGKQEVGNCSVNLPGPADVRCGDEDGSQTSVSLISAQNQHFYSETPSFPFIFAQKRKENVSRVALKSSFCVFVSWIRVLHDQNLRNKQTLLDRPSLLKLSWLFDMKRNQNLDRRPTNG